MSGVPHVSVVGPVLFLCTPRSFFLILENKLIGYVNNSTLASMVSSSDGRVTVAESLKRDLDKVTEWCDLLGMKLNASNTKIMMMLYEIRCIPMYPLYGTLLVPFVPVLVTHIALVTELYTYAPRRSRTSQHCMTFISLSISLWIALTDPIFDGVGLEGVKRRTNAFYWPKLLAPYLSYTVFPFSSFFREVGIVGSLD